MIVRDYNHSREIHKCREIVLDALPIKHELACTAHELTEDLPKGTDERTVVRLLLGLYNHGYCIRERTYRTGKGLYQYWRQSSDSNQKKAEDVNAQSIYDSSCSIEGLQQLDENLRKKNPSYYNSSYYKQIQKRRKDILERLPIGHEHAVTANELAYVPTDLRSVSRILADLSKQGFCHRESRDIGEHKGYVYWRSPPVITFDEISHTIIHLLGDLGFQVAQDAGNALAELIDEYKRFYRTDEEEVKRGLPALIVENMPKNEFVIPSDWLTAIKEELMLVPSPKSEDGKSCSVAGLKRLVDNLREIKEVDVVNPEIPHAALLERLDKVEAETEAIRERYEVLEKRLVENELLTALKKAELEKEEEQHKLDALEERMKRWENENADVVEGILK